MAIAFSGAFGFAQTTNGSSLTTPSRTTTGGNSVLLVGANWRSTGQNFNTPTDNKSNTYAISVQGNDGDSQRIVIGHSHSIAGGTGHTVTVTMGTGSFARINALEYSGMAAATPEATNTNSGTAANPTSGAVTASANAVCVAAMSHESATFTIAPGAGWTQRAEDEDVNNGQPLSAIDRTSAGASETGSWTMGAPSPSEWVACVASFTESSGSPVTIAVPVGAVGVAGALEVIGRGILMPAE